jgi:hypothetical protein
MFITQIALLALITTISAFVCPTPVIPGKTPSNACCKSLTLIPGAGEFNPAGGSVYWGTSCELMSSPLLLYYLTRMRMGMRMKLMKEGVLGVAAINNVTISATQENSLECAKGSKDACCDPVSSIQAIDKRQDADCWGIDVQGDFGKWALYFADLGAGSGWIYIQA